MLTITYNYRCDICGQEIWPSDKYQIGPNVPAQNMSLPIPKPIPAIGQFDACSECLHVARDAVRSRVVDNLNLYP
jgi:hypothetical protein